MIKFNTDVELVKEIRARIKDNGGYCPCALEHTPDTKCMCKDFRNKIANGYLGECTCGLYVATNDLMQRILRS